MFVHFREKIGVNLVNKVNKQMVREVLLSDDSQTTEKKESSEKERSEITNQGKLLLDTTCANADISYPNDLVILNQARQKSEQIIDSL